MSTLFCWLPANPGDVRRPYRIGSTTPLIIRAGHQGQTQVEVVDTDCQSRPMVEIFHAKNQDQTPVELDDPSRKQFEPIERIGFEQVTDVRQHRITRETDHEWHQLQFLCGGHARVSYTHEGYLLSIHIAELELRLCGGLALLCRHGAPDFTLS